MDGHVETSPSLTKGCTPLSAQSTGSTKTGCSDRRQVCEAYWDYELARLEGLVHKNFHGGALLGVHRCERRLPGVRQHGRGVSGGAQDAVPHAGVL
eukprot:CAMPEP_0203944742 /NCGR_PEP_ID=MMETSP0359-20131031/80439_1 /ASSEMBLY_ACC=CAM_ASM_000338 /TAXON_ID=268821 /ORGANISM="Scrippsiella Hangoei, Strain SHTV-5" /LENGTH=95 /DNA_ID=CAMNT_0050875803 /DNA_START=14 /DNA_END=299 /DNA_ORIENTATION=-